MFNCPNPSCEQPVPETAQFCPSCGTSIAAASVASDGSMVGRVLNQKYRLVEQMAEGGMAIVYKAERIFLDDFCAVKIVKKGLSSKEEMLKRFQREAKLTNKVARRSPFIIDIYDFDVEEGVGFYYVMELLNGFPFADILQDKSLPPPALNMVRYVCQMCEALAVVHEEGLIHRDIKPDNIFLHRDSGSGEQGIKLLDFGIARPTYAKATMLTNYGRVMGTPEYMSPEQCKGPTPEQYERGESHLDGRSDIYSLGVLLYQGLTGEVPFPLLEDGGPMSIHKVMAGHVMDEPVSLLEARPDLEISAELSAVTLKSLAKEPADRFQTMLDFRDALLSCFPQLAQEFLGVSMDASAMHVSTFSELEEHRPGESTDEARIPPLESHYPELEADSIPLDQTALDVQLPESLLKSLHTWTEQNPQLQTPSQPSTETPVETSSLVEDWNSHLEKPSSSPDMLSKDFDMGKTVTEPMAPEVLKQIQQHSDEFNHQASMSVKAEVERGAKIPFAPRYKRKQVNTPALKHPPRAGTNWGKLIFYFLTAVAAVLGIYLLFLLFGAK